MLDKIKNTPDGTHNFVIDNGVYVYMTRDSVVVNVTRQAETVFYETFPCTDEGAREALALYAKIL